VGLFQKFMEGREIDLRKTVGAKRSEEGHSVLRSKLGGITVNTFEVETGQQDAYYDNIKLEAAP